MYAAHQRVMTGWVKTTNDPSDSRLKRGRGEGWWCGGRRLKMPLRLAFEVREGEQGGGQDHNLKLFVNIGFYYNKDLPVPLQLTFEVREGRRVKTPPPTRV
jgi:hypothetical protein